MLRVRRDTIKETFTRVRRAHDAWFTKMNNSLLINPGYFDEAERKYEGVLARIEERLQGMMDRP